LHTKDRRSKQIRYAKLQVVAILEAGNPLPFKIQAADLDLPELQGEPEDIAREKCRLAAEQVHTCAAGYMLSIQHLAYLLSISTVTK
jgi:hypothetical protein